MSKRRGNVEGADDDTAQLISSTNTAAERKTITKETLAKGKAERATSRTAAKYVAVDNIREDIRAKLETNSQNIKNQRLALINLENKLLLEKEVLQKVDSTLTPQELKELKSKNVDKIAALNEQIKTDKAKLEANRKKLSADRKAAKTEDIDLTRKQAETKTKFDKRNAKLKALGETGTTLTDKKHGGLENTKISLTKDAERIQNLEKKDRAAREKKADKESAAAYDKAFKQSTKLDKAAKAVEGAQDEYTTKYNARQRVRDHLSTNADKIKSDRARLADLQSKLVAAKASQAVIEPGLTPAELKAKNASDKRVIANLTTDIKSNTKNLEVSTKALSKERALAKARDITLEKEQAKAKAKFEKLAAAEGKLLTKDPKTLISKEEHTPLKATHKISLTQEEKRAATEAKAKDAKNIAASEKKFKKEYKKAKIETKKNEKELKAITAHEDKNKKKLEVLQQRESAATKAENETKALEDKTKDFNTKITQTRDKKTLKELSKQMAALEKRLQTAEKKAADLAEKVAKQNEGPQNIQHYESKLQTIRETKDQNPIEQRAIEAEQRKTTNITHDLIALNPGDTDHEAKVKTFVSNIGKGPEHPEYIDALKEVAKSAITNTTSSRDVAQARDQFMDITKKHDLAPGDDRHNAKAWSAAHAVFQVKGNEYKTQEFARAHQLPQQTPAFQPSQLAERRREEKLAEIAAARTALKDIRSISLEEFTKKYSPKTVEIVTKVMEISTVERRNSAAQGSPPFGIVVTPAAAKALPHGTSRI